MLSYAVGCIWIILQLFLIGYHWDYPVHDDAWAYRELAARCLSENSWYPTQSDLHSLFIFAPGYVNLLILCHKLFGAFVYYNILNLMMNILVAWEVMYLARRIFHKAAGYVSLIFYCILFSNLYLPIAQLSDLPFVCLISSAICLCISASRWWKLILAGVLIALANWMRPFALIYLIALIAYFFLQKRDWKSYVYLILPVVAILFFIGKRTEQRMGKFVYQSTTSGINLSMTCSHRANGLVNISLYNDPAESTYIPDIGQYTFDEIDALKRASGIRWILDNPVRYAMFLPVKLIALYCEDTWSERVLPDKGFRVVFQEKGADLGGWIQLGISLFLKSLSYYLVLLFFMYYLWTEKWFVKRNIWLIIPLLGTAMTIALVVTSRYHYPFMFIIIPYAASAFCNYAGMRWEKKC